MGKSRSLNWESQTALNLGKLLWYGKPVLDTMTMGDLLDRLTLLAASGFAHDAWTAKSSA